MPVQLLVSVNGGGPQSGGIDVPSGALIAFSAASIVGWKQQRWEFYEYPEGWGTPAGWTLGADGTIYSTVVSPSSVTLPANTVLWGPWSLRLKINEAVDDDSTEIAGLVDEATILNMLSPLGQRMIAALEEEQNCTATTLQKKWVRSIQRTMVTLEGLFKGAGPGGVLTKNMNNAAAVLSDAELAAYGTIKITSTPSAFSANRNLTIPSASDALSFKRTFRNTQAGAFSVVLTTGAGTTVSVAQGKAVTVGVDSTGVWLAAAST